MSLLSAEVGRASDLTLQISLCLSAGWHWTARCSVVIVLEVKWKFVRMFSYVCMWLISSPFMLLVTSKEEKWWHLLTHRLFSWRRVRVSLSAAPPIWHTDLHILYSHNTKSNIIQSLFGGNSDNYHVKCSYFGKDVSFIQIISVYIAQESPKSPAPLRISRSLSSS